MAIKVLHIVTQLELGGAQKNALDILSHLDRLKYEIHLISSDGLLSAQARAIPGLRFRSIDFLKRAPGLFSDLRALLFLIFYMRKNKIDVVHTHSSKAGILGRWAAHFAGVPVIIHTVHGWGFHDYVRSFLNNFFIYLERITAGITTRLIAVSEADVQKGLAHGIGLAEQYVLIRCGIASAPIKEPGFYLTQKYSLGFTKDDLIVGMVACLKPQKNPLDLIAVSERVLEGYPQAKFLLVGDGILRKKVKIEIEKRRLEDSVFMLGWRKDIEDIMPFFDIVVLTSLWEGLPLVFLEAMHLAKPIVAYDICGIGEVVKDGVNGFLVRPGDVEGFSAKVSLLLRDEGLRRRMGQFGRHIVSQEAFSPSAMMRRIEALYEDELRRLIP
ncbi:MAG: glycosyltransferase family 4 protein [Candidatus Omnitrophica bacterium]|nr:glycosyltransferase family 4 protein [Candidatus Omnitrophota bacterium]